jgi:hypothetical protein
VLCDGYAYWYLSETTLSFLACAFISQSITLDEVSQLEMVYTALLLLDSLQSSSSVHRIPTPMPRHDTLYSRHSCGFLSYHQDLGFDDTLTTVRVAIW